MGKSISAIEALSQYCKQNHLPQPEYKDGVDGSYYTVTCHVAGLHRSLSTGSSQESPIVAKCKAACYILDFNGIKY